MFDIVCSVALRRGVIGWSAVCDCVIKNKTKVKFENLVFPVVANKGKCTFQRTSIFVYNL